jgi:membrane-bound lytic murein transglycosylase B
VISIRRTAALVLGVLLVVGLPAHSASAESASHARAQARKAAAEVAALQPKVEKARVAYEQALSRLAVGVNVSVTADAQADAARLSAQRQQRQVNGRVRALYMAGGTAALYASVLDATSASDALQRVAYIQRIIAVGSAAARVSDVSSTSLRARAGALAAAVENSVVTVAEVQRKYDELQALLGQSGAALARLSAKARSLEEAAAAAAMLAALSAQVAQDSLARVARAKAVGVPADFRALYIAAAKTCNGLPWTVLAAIGQVESGHGRNAGTSYAGAQGPMQFLPSTFASYAVDGDRDGSTDINSPADAIFTAAHYLCANGAGRGPAALYRAIWHYNHADWYVQLVLKIAGQLAAKP